MSSPLTHKEFQFDQDRFVELMAFIARGSIDDPTFGAVKLNKIPYYADFSAYRMFGQPLTGATYFKLQEGPAPREMLQARRTLLDSGGAHIEERPYFTGVQNRLVIDADHLGSGESLLEAERKLVKTIMDFFHGKTAREVSDYSHREPGWELAHDRETIPYETAWLSSEPPDRETEELAELVLLERQRR